MNKNKKHHEIENSRLLVLREVPGTEYEEDGKTYIKTKWELVDRKPINFGSCAKPQNKDVSAFKIEVPRGKPHGSFWRLFGE